MTVYCETCEHMMLPFKEAAPRHALCRMHRNEGGMGFVSLSTWASEAPYLPCYQMNPRGTCPLWSRKRDNQIEAEV